MDVPSGPQDDAKPAMNQQLAKTVETRWSVREKREEKGGEADALRALPAAGSLGFAVETAPAMTWPENIMKEPMKRTVRRPRWSTARRPGKVAITLTPARGEHKRE